MRFSASTPFPVRYLDIEQLAQLLSEARQKEATLDVRKPGSERPVQMVMSPALLDAPTVDRAYMVAPGIGHLRITRLRGTHRPAGQTDHREAGRRVPEGPDHRSARQSGRSCAVRRGNRRAVSLARSAHLQHRRAQHQARAGRGSRRMHRPTLFRSRFWSTARAPAPPRSSPARCRITIAPSCWASRASARV